MSLHTWNKSDTQHATLATCLAALAPGDALLLIEDGVVALLHPGFVARIDALSAAGVKPFALAPDLAARGLSAKIPARVTVIGYDDFVALCLQHDRVINWN